MYFHLMRRIGLVACHHSTIGRNIRRRSALLSSCFPMTATLDPLPPSPPVTL
jgi:hypothetical protein